MGRQQHLFDVVLFGSNPALRSPTQPEWPPSYTLSLCVRGIEGYASAEGEGGGANKTTAKNSWASTNILPLCVGVLGGGANAKDAKIKRTCARIYRPQFSRKQTQNARFHLIENERFGWFSRKQGL
jgi:hypothetical protein